ncbi:hypothetical protein NQ315_001961 [Exocentrus adspersus]|uniref:Uncharacterized protein n=1 Tax=Exocentrus adspersus TaxID=1586481 RepID=A0AAV8WAR4_9CUCU|nr:hypothetical protein NQ315_001961 [Exocentrus adspersus]
MKSRHLSVGLEVSNVCLRRNVITELIGQTVNYGLSGAEEHGFACGCLPACSSLTYNAEFSQSHFNWQKVFEGYRENMSELPGVHFTRLTMFFKESQFIPAERNEMFGLTDFLANCGGILGLFTGFSILSLAEIIYFLSLRLMCNLKNYGRHYWSASPKYISNYT